MIGIKEVKIDKFLNKLKKFENINVDYNLNNFKPLIITFEIKSNPKTFKTNNNSFQNKNKLKKTISDKLGYNNLINDIYNCITKNFCYLNQNLSNESSYITILLINKNYNPLFNYLSDKDFINISKEDLKSPFAKISNQDLNAFFYLYNGKNIKKNVNLLSLNLILEIKKLIDKTNFFNFFFNFIKNNSSNLYNIYPLQYEIDQKENLHNHFANQINVKNNSPTKYNNIFDLINSNYWTTLNIKKVETEEIKKDELKINLNSINNNIFKHSSKLNSKDNKKIVKKKKKVKDLTDNQINKHKNIKKPIKTDRVMLSKKSDYKLQKKKSIKKNKVKNSYKLKLDLNNINNNFNNNLKDKNNDKIAIPESSRKLQNDNKNTNEITLVYKDFLYISNFKSAYNKNILFENNITHIVNCAGDYNNSQYRNFIYKVYHLKDSKNENIECCFYDFYKFIEFCINNFKYCRILVHCVQGISRSVTLATSYIMLKENLNFQDAFEIIKSKRVVASPNINFHLQLKLFSERIFYEFSNTIQILKIFIVGSFQKETPDVLAIKLIQDEEFYKIESKKNYKLDPRGCFLIQNNEKLFVWVGNDCDRKNLFLDLCFDYIEYLKKFEGVSELVGVFNQNEEGNYFWENNFPNHRFYSFNDLYDYNKTFNDLFPKVYYNKNILSSKRIFEKKKKNLKRDELYLYPDYINSSTIFDLDDLMINSYAILCLKNRIVCLWKGVNFKETDLVY